MVEYFGDYEILGPLGRGGMGDVYRARKRGYRRTVALKRLSAEFADDPRFVARFRRECDIAERLEHDHIAPIYEFGAHDGQLFIAMRLIDGQNLAEVIRNGVLPLPEAIDICVQVASALDYAHGVGVEHRDIKPSNIVLAPQQASGGRPTAYLVDFGIARSDDLSALTSTGVVGSVPWMAPERIRGERSDFRSDTYSLACVLFEMITGGPPYPRDSLTAIMWAHIHAPVPRPSEVADVPSALDAVVIKGLAKEPGDRYPSAGAFAAAAREAVEAPLTKDLRYSTTTDIPPAPVPTPPAPPHPLDTEVAPRRPRVAVWSVAVVTALVVAAVAAFALTHGGSSGHAAAGRTSSSSGATPGGSTVGAASPSGTAATQPAGPAQTPTDALTVGTCLTAASQPVGCQAAHASEVYATSTACSRDALVQYLGGQPGTDTLLPAISERSSVVEGRQVCTVHGPQPGDSTTSARNVLRSGAGAAWRLCYDSLTAISLACSKPHTTEYVYAATLSAGASVNCTAQASAYLGAAYADFADQLDVMRAVSGSRIACALVVRGGDVLTTSVRSIQEGTLPLQPR